MICVDQPYYLRRLDVSGHIYGLVHETDEYSDTPNGSPYKSMDFADAFFW
jgi:hypothetical protein